MNHIDKYYNQYHNIGSNMVNLDRNPAFLETSAFVDERFRSDGFDSRRLSDFEMPEYRTVGVDGAPVMGYTLHGNLDAAENVVLVGSKFLTPHRSLHYQVLLEAYQTALGSEYCVVGCDQYPNDGSTDPSGIEDNSVFSEATVRLIELLKLRDDQKLVLYGYSMGADIAIKTAHDMLEKESMGIRRVDGLWAAEFVRSKLRSPSEVLNDFKQSADGMEAQIAESRVLALSEAWGANPDKGKDKLSKAGPVAAFLGAGAYLLSHPAINMRLYKGFGRPDSSIYLSDLVGHRSDAPDMVISRYAQSSLCNSEAFLILSGLRGITGYQTSGNHVRIDNIRHAASLMLHYATATRLED